MKAGSSTGQKKDGKETELKQRTTVDTGPQRNDAFISLRSYFCVICWERYKKQGEGESLRSFYSLIDETFLLYGKRGTITYDVYGHPERKNAK